MDPGTFQSVASYAIAVIAVVLAIMASAHAILYKRDSRAAIVWMGFIWLVPLVGAALYFILGVNRIRRQAGLLRGTWSGIAPRRSRAVRSRRVPPASAGPRRTPGPARRAVGKVVTRPLLPGNRIEPLVNGDEAFPAMLEAIGQGPPVRFVLDLHLRPRRGRAGLCAGAGRGGAARGGGARVD